MPPAYPRFRGSRSTSGRAGCSASTRRVASSAALSTTTIRCGRSWVVRASRQAPRCALPRQVTTSTVVRITSATLSGGGGRPAPGWQAEPVPVLVAIADQLLAPVPGGTGRYTRELLRAMAAAAPAGWELATVVSRSGDPAAARIPGVAGPRVLPLPRRALSAAWEHGLPLWPGGDAVHAMTPLAPPARNRHLVVTV